MIRFRFAPIAGTAALLLSIAACREGGQQTGGAATDTMADTMALQHGPATERLLNPNTASREELAAAPGMTPAATDSVLARRPFNSMMQVDSVLGRAGLNEQQRDSVYQQVFMPINLNTATDEEMKLIPGVGDRMVREFKEYRPWTSVEQFRREIGKYVDDEEVTRLERYVTF